MAPHPGQAARILLDGVRPLGVTQLAIDAASLLGPLGSLPDDEIARGLTLLGDDLLVPLGTAVVCRGGERGAWRCGSPCTAPAGRPGADRGPRRPAPVLPLARGQEAELMIEPAPGVTLGAARRSPRITATVTGGAVGLILDARGIPIALPRRGDDRREVIAGWRDTFDARSGRRGARGMSVVHRVRLPVGATPMVEVGHRVEPAEVLATRRAPRGGVSVPVAPPLRRSAADAAACLVARPGARLDAGAVLAEDGRGRQVHVSGGVPPARLRPRRRLGHGRAARAAASRCSATCAARW